MKDPKLPASAWNPEFYTPHSPGRTTSSESNECVDHGCRLREAKARIEELEAVIATHEQTIADMTLAWKALEDGTLKEDY